MSIYRIKINGKTYEMEIELLEEGKPKKPQKIQKSHEQPMIKHKEKADQKKIETNSNTVISPMPGNVVEILARVGDEVKENDVILILEAMKMENEVTSSKTGIIKKFFVNKDQSVAAGDPLFELEE